MKTFMTAHMWDLEREGLESAVTRLGGQVGVDAITVHALSSPMVRACQDETGMVMAFECEDGACFQPDTALYTGTRLRPHVMDWIKQRNPMDALVRAAEKHRMGLRARINCCHQPSLARRNPAMACVNILGVTSSNWLCPSQAGVREYLTAIAEDLSRNYAPSVLDLAHLHFPEVRTPSAFPPMKAGVNLTCASELLNWCFCSSCRERMAASGIDIQNITARAQHLLRNLLALEEETEREVTDWLAHDSACKGIRAVQAQTIESLVTAIRQRVTSDLCIVRDADTQSGMLDCAVENDLAPVSGSRSAPVYKAYPPYAADGPALVTAIHAAASAGHDTIGFAEYGLLCAKSTDWVRQAIRFAKRESAR
jgi:hypothetical protein